MMNQSMVSGGSSVGMQSQSQNQQYSNVYGQEIQGMFMSPDFKAGSIQDKKEIVGNTIYKHVEKIIGESKAPKITGMLIDLPDTELNFSISTWANFSQKVQSAFALINECEGQASSAASPAAQEQ